MKFIFSRFIQLIIFLVILGVGQHVARAESSSENQFQSTHFQKFDLAKLGLRVHAKQSNSEEISKVKTFYEESEVEVVEIESLKRNNLYSNAYFGSFLPESFSQDEKPDLAFENNKPYPLPVEIYILHQVFRI
jgi:hypothetical protein